MTDFLTGAEYLRHAYKIPTVSLALPLPDEPFVSKWQAAPGREALALLADKFKLPSLEPFPQK